MRSNPTCLSLLAIAACAGGDKHASDADASAPALDAASGLASSCEGNCQEQTLSASFAGTTLAFDRAFFGLSAPSESIGGGWEVYLESSAGGESSCPTETSPPPRALLRVAGLAVPGADPTTTSGTVNLFDFDGTLLSDSVVAGASSNTVSWAAADVCVACSEGSEEDRADRMLAVDIDATFDEGTISGHVFATHCDSLDAL